MRLFSFCTSSLTFILAINLDSAPFYPYVNFFGGDSRQLPSTAFLVDPSYCCYRLFWQFSYHVIGASLTL